MQFISCLRSWQNRLAALALTAFCSTAHAAPAEYLVRQPLTLQAGGNMVQLQPGQTVTVLGTSGTQAMIRLVLPNGTMSVVQAPLASLAPKPPATPSPRAATPLPAVVPATPRPQLAASAAPAPAPAQPGAQVRTLAALPAPKEKPKWFDYQFDPAAEKFRVYLPRTYQAGKPCGFLGWTNPGDGDGLPEKFFPLFDEFRLIAVAAERCGNKQAPARRVGLLVSAMLELSKEHAIDPKRVVLSGMSGGGRVSALGAFAHPELISGAICWCGGHYPETYPELGKANANFAGINQEGEKWITPSNKAEAKRNCKFALLTGSEDFNLNNTRSIAAVMKTDRIKSLLIEEPGLGHAVGSVENMRKALEFVLGPPAR